jgi:hypothetical protein
MWHIYIGPRVKYKIIQVFEWNISRLFQNNNNNNNLNNQILIHVVTHHLPSIVTKIVTS